MIENKNFCPAPWTSIYFDPAGEVDNCCVAKNYLGNVNTDSIQNIIFSEKNQQVKQHMLDNKEVDGCKWCFNKSHSLQQLMLRSMPKFEESALYSSTENFNLQYLDVRWSNTCNLACVYCSPTYSSLWAQELDQEVRLDRSAKDKLLNYVLENIKTLKHIYMAGGEPLLMKENDLVVSALAEHNPECSVKVNTNLTQVKSNKLFNNLTQLKNCDWLVSVEAMGNKFEYIRFPAKWHEFEENLEILKSSVPMQKIGFNMVFTSLNGLEFWDTVDWLMLQGFGSYCMSIALYNNGTYKGPFDLRHLPVDYQQQVLIRMSDSKYHSMPGWQNAYDYLNAGIHITETDLWNYLSELDQRRGLNSQAVFSNIYQYKD
jgi:radical SAM protein with 4Fe4S-binding SPASM domain